MKFAYLLSSLSGSDYFGCVIMLIWETFMLWIVNRSIYPEASLGALFTTWPWARPKEFRLWLAMSAVLVVGLCLLLNVDTAAGTLSWRHETAPGTFDSYHGQHAVFRYTFTVHGLQYYGEDSSDQQDLAATEAGAPFTVYYDPANPNTNSVSEPTHRVSTNRMSLAFFLGALPIGLLAVIVRKMGALIRASAMSRAASS